MKKMIRFLEDLYSLEESSQAKIDSDMMRVIDSYKAASEPNRILLELQSQIKQMESENIRLKEEVRSNGNCGRCAARDQRRALRQRGAISLTVPTSPEAGTTHSPYFPDREASGRERDDVMQGRTASNRPRNYK
jgi:hypothetical protein